MTGYTGFSGAVEEQSGNYLAIHASVPDESGVTITAKLEDGERTVTLDSDGLLILRIKGEDILEKGIVFTASKAGCRNVVREWALNGLTLEAEE